jgi:hypothetical protein
MNNKIWQTIKSFIYLDKMSWVLLVLALIGNTTLWYVWIYKIHFSQTTMFYCTAVIGVNFILSFLFSRKDPIIPYFLLFSALLVQLFILILLKYTTLLMV